MSAEFIPAGHEEGDVACRVCLIEDWLMCGCYYLYGGQGGLGDMNTKLSEVEIW